MKQASASGAVRLVPEFVFSGQDSPDDIPRTVGDYLMGEWLTNAAGCTGEQVNRPN